MGRRGRGNARRSTFNVQPSTFNVQRTTVEAQSPKLKAQGKFQDSSGQIRPNVGRPARRGAGAFTLIELLVVMAIIGILASMMLPSLSGAKEQAHQINCVSNLRQLGVGLQLYRDDHDFRFPPKTVLETHPTSPNTWVSKDLQFGLGGRDPVFPLSTWSALAASRPLNPYVAPSPVYRCMRDRGQTALGIVPSNYEALGSSYHYNAGSLTVPQGAVSANAPSTPRRDWPVRRKPGCRNRSGTS
ncbi:MAG: type II secretion system GspH family protein [Verrucomicrobia bacterium]|nr:type II secretion system GspH family protein [Verrucomicrobiota bacterium]